MDRERLRYYAEWHRYANERRYEAPPDPWEPIDVDPERIEHYVGARLNWGLGRIEGGDWDRESDRYALRETATYRGLVERFEEGRDWEETAIYERAKAGFENGRPVRGYDSLDEFRRVRCPYLDELYERIRTEGYRPNRRAGHENPAAADNAFEDAAVHHLEPLVTIARDGEILLTEGVHRVSIADVLGLDSVPVQVLRRHEQWQEVRDRIHGSSGDPPDLDSIGDHPDLADVRG